MKGGFCIHFEDNIKDFLSLTLPFWDILFYFKDQEPVLSLVVEMILSDKAKTMQNHEN